MADGSRRPQHNPQYGLGPLTILPLFFNLQGKRAIVAGGSAAAAWKAELIAAAGAEVDVYAVKPGAEMRSLAARAPRVRLHDRRWREDDLKAALAVADLPEREEAVRFRVAAHAAGALANVVDQPEFCDFQFGAIVERTPLVVGVATAGAAPALAQAVRARVEALLPQSLRAWTARAASWRPRTQELDARARRRFWSRFAARALADREPPPAEEDFEAAFADALAATPGQEQGSVALVGAGPGDPDLLTLKAVRALQTADVVLFDDLASPEAVAMARREARKITVGKRGYKPSCTQEDIAKLLVGLARQGKRVVRLKGGDPLIFGRANEEMEALAAAGVAVELIPGVTAAAGAAAAVGRSLTERDLARRVQFVTAHAKNGRLPDDLNWVALADPHATTAVYMGLRTLPALVGRLLEAGMDPQTPAALVENASKQGERVVRAPLCDLPAQVAAAGLTGPCLTLIGWAIGPAKPPA